MEIYLLRHAQSLWQVGKTEDKDSEITSLGFSQSDNLNKKIKEIIDSKDNNHCVIYCSPMKRSLQTIKSLGEKYIVDTRIKEASFHVSSSLPKYESVNIYPKILVSERKYKIFKKNIHAFFNEIIKLNEKATIFIYTHAGFIKTALRVIHDNDGVCYTVNNCSITKLIWYRSRWNLYSLNDTSFLPRNLVT